MPKFTLFSIMRFRCFFFVIPTFKHFKFSFFYLLIIFFILYYVFVFSSFSYFYFFRKHFGWFFANIKIKGANKAIENKQPPALQPQPTAAVSPQIAETKPAPAPKPAQPAPKPVVAPTPAPSPPKPIEKPAPATPPTTPTTSPSIKPTSSPTTFKKEVVADALDKKLKEASKPFENGNEKLKANLKDATTGFLVNESQREPERYTL